MGKAKLKTKKAGNCSLFDKKRGDFLIRLFFVIIISILGHTIWSQEKGTKTTFKQKSGIVTTQKATSLASSITKEDIVQEAQRSLDRSIGILNIVATSMGVLVGLITIVLLIAAGFGIFEFRRWRKIREQSEKFRDEAKKTADEVKKLEIDVKPIVDRIKKSEEELNNTRSQIRPVSITETPSEELKKKLDEVSKKIEFLESFGVQLKPEDYFNRGLDLYYKGKYELALKAFEKMIEIKPDYADAWCNKGAALGKLGRYPEALKAYEKAIEIKPDYVEAWDNKSVELNKLGRYEEALKACDNAIEIKPDFANAWYNRACTYSLKGDKENALGDLSKAIQLDAKYKEKAKKDEDFKNFWDDEDFKKIVS